MNVHAIIILALSLALSACSKEKHQPKTFDERVEDLQTSYALRSDALRADLNPVTFWISNTDCDSTLFAGLSVVVGMPTRIELAEYLPGEIHRRPQPSCWNAVQGDVGSKSTVSNDMLIGYLWARWHQKDLGALQRLAAYGEAHNWQMGEPISRPGEVLLKPNQQGLLGRMIYALTSGRDDRSYRRLFTYYSPVSADFERHLQALGILLQGEVDEKLRLSSLDATRAPVEGATLLDISQNMLSRLQELVAAEPKNAMFQAALATYSGDFTRTLELLLDEETTCPTYARGERADLLCQLHWLFAAQILLKRQN